MTQDPRLQAALEHAPDRDAEAPAHVSAAILQQARAALRPAAPPARARPAWARLQAWLAPPRWATGFATAALVVLVGTVWRLTPEAEWSRPADRETAPPVAEARKLETPPNAPAGASHAEARQDARPPAADLALPRQATNGPARRAAAPVAQAKPQPAPVPQAPAPVPSIAPAPVAPPPAPPVAAAPAAPAANTSAGITPLREMADAAMAAPPVAKARRMEAAPPPAEPPSLSALAQALPGEPGLSAWLAQLRQVTTGRWQHADEAQLPAEAQWRLQPSASAGPLLIQRAGDTVWCLDRDGSLWRAPLPAQAAALPPPP